MTASEVRFTKVRAGFRPPIPFPLRSKSPGGTIKAAAGALSAENYMSQVFPHRAAMITGRVHRFCGFLHPKPGNSRYFSAFF